MQRACDAVTTAARRQKYGEEIALSHSPGSTPDHVRRSYEDEQRRLDEAAAEIIANSESEAEPACPDKADFRSGGLGCKSRPEQRANFMARNTNSIAMQYALASRDLSPYQPKHIQLAGQQAAALPSSDIPSHSQHYRHGVQSGFQASMDASCSARAQTAFRISNLRRKYRLREQHRSSLMVGS